MAMKESTYDEIIVLLEAHSLKREGLQLAAKQFPQ